MNCDMQANDPRCQDVLVRAQGTLQQRMEGFCTNSREQKCMNCAAVQGVCSTPNHSAHPITYIIKQVSVECSTHCACTRIVRKAAPITAAGCTESCIGFSSEDERFRWLQQGAWCLATSARACKAALRGACQPRLQSVSVTRMCVHTGDRAHPARMVGQDVL
jgi:hypothetical protein